LPLSSIVLHNTHTHTCSCTYAVCTYSACVDVCVNNNNQKGKGVGKVCVFLLPQRKVVPQFCCRSAKLCPNFSVCQAGFSCTPPPSTLSQGTCAVPFCCRSAKLCPNFSVCQAGFSCTPPPSTLSQGTCAVPGSPEFRARAVVSWLLHHQIRTIRRCSA